MEIQITDTRSERIAETVVPEPEFVEASACDEPYIMIPNTTNYKEPWISWNLESPLDIEEKYGVKPCSVELERCDKIWETLQLIRDLQEDVDPELAALKNTFISTFGEAASSYDDLHSSTQANPAPYIQYEPVLNNGNTALPNFQFSIKSTRLLHQCVTCGKQYSHRTTLREHSEKVHNIIIPTMRNKADNFHDQKHPEVKEEYIPHTDDSNSGLDSEYDGRVENSVDAQSAIDKKFCNPTKKYPCHLCSKAYNRAGHLARHIKAIHEPQEPPRNNLNVHQCNQCGKHFYHSSSKRTHCRKVHGIYVRKMRTANVEPVNKKNKRAKIENTPASVHPDVKAVQIMASEKMSQTLKTSRKPRSAQNSEDTFNCLICGENFPNRVTWLQHCEENHEVERGLRRETCSGRRCNECSRNFSSSAGLLRHMWGEHRLFLHYQCRTCGHRFKHADALINHAAADHKIIVVPRYRKNVSARNNMKCDKCSNAYRRIDTLRLHKLQVHGEPPELIRPTVRSRPSSDADAANQSDSKQVLHDNMVRRLSQGARETRNSARWKMENMAGTPENGRSSRRSLRETTRVNYDENLPFVEMNCKTESSSAPLKELILQIKQEKLDSEPEVEEVPPLPPAPVSTPPPPPPPPRIPSNRQAGDVICLLCGKRCKIIKRHLIHYHKIRRPDTLISQCRRIILKNRVPKAEPKIPFPKVIHNKNKFIFSNETEIPGVIASKYARKRIPVNLPPNGLWQNTSISANNIRSYICKHHPQFSCCNWRAMQIHELEFHPQYFRPYKPFSYYATEDLSPPVSRKRKRESTDNKGTRRRRLSDPLVKTTETRTTRASIRLKELLEHRCPVCSRLFRNAEILSSHKISCTTPPETRFIVNDHSDTRASSDRDSGIGISITIKKRNNSYEIVGRDGAEEGKTLGIQTPESSKDGISSSEVSLDNVPLRVGENFMKSTVAFEYSKDHELIKIQHADEGDDIDLESVEPQMLSTTILLSDDKPPPAVIKIEVDDPSYAMDVGEPVVFKVPRLTEMCERVLATFRNSNSHNAA